MSLLRFNPFLVYMCQLLGQLSYFWGKLGPKGAQLDPCGLIGNLRISVEGRIWCNIT